MQLTIILLAAGFSSRMVVAGKVYPKGILLFPRTNQTLLEYQLKTFLTYQNLIFSPFIEYSKISLNYTIILGPQKIHYLPIIHRFKNGLNLNFTVIENESPQEGTFSSLKLGLNQIVQEKDLNKLHFTLIQPLDTPLPSQTTIQQMILSLYFHKKSYVAIPFNEVEKKHGHPIIINSNSPYISKLLSVPNNSPRARLDHQLKELPKEQKVIVSVNDPNITFNINTFSCWKKYLELLNS